MSTPSISTLDQRVKGLSHHVAELQRKSRGTTRANTRAAKLERELASLIEALAILQTRVDGLGSSAPNGAFGAELQRLDRKVDSLFKDLETELARVRDQVANHEGRLASHDERIEAVEVRSNENATAINSLRQARQAASSIRPIAYLVGIVAGVFAYVVWSSHNFTEEVVVNGVSATVENTAASTSVAAVLCGVAVGLFALFLASLFFKENGEENEEGVQATTEVDTTEEVETQGHQDEPTQVHPGVPQPPPPSPVATPAPAST